ncbi:antibiotic biosynthesis monooxygenase [Inquilinus limosus]|uniref:putative quinol monooxygenase n=1 Tax=Inquilinus limosus TaxID=171674 RepID=UPI003F186DD3
MNAKTVLAASLLTLSPGGTSAEPMQEPYIRLAELEIDPARAQEFSAAIRDEIETAVRVEPGVLALYAVFEKDDPARVRVFEVYADETAYRTHLQTPHFQKFRADTETMVRSRRLLDAVPIVLGAKAK